DVNVLLVLAQTAAAMIESFHLNKMIDEQLMIDERTGIYNKRFLLSRLDEDITRAEDYEEQLSFVLFGIDDSKGVAEKLGAERVDSVLASIAKIVTQHVRMYDAVGRYDNECIGIVLVGKSDEEAYLWTEKVRKDIASTVLTLGTKKLSITASAGICGIRHQATHVDLVNGAIQALERAHEIGGNTIMVY
ncbi:MAG TPA: GGDEF domain-containing protein, partial [Candidatus Kapabacteria bacterium]|nr:GGDEF domain-containing protein [Candidatus Kapabacteria bacterium]